jgi:thioredoxin-dependent peroxiredoxin
VGAEVVGISHDTPEDQKAFAEAERFPYRLLSDVDKAIGTAYGVLRDPDDRLYAFGPKRITYLIDPEGVIVRTYDLDDHKGLDVHADRVLADIRELQAGR